MKKSIRKLLRVPVWCCFGLPVWDMEEAIRKLLSPIRRKKIHVFDFSIISNNCWGGKVYQRYGLEYASPTVGLYFFADDYIRFLKRLEYYLSTPIKCIPATRSKYYEILKKRNQLKYPIGLIDDVEIVFLHYKTEAEAIQKWERRRKRVNFSNLIVKFSQMNLCTEENLHDFEELSFDVKFVFTNRNRPDLPSSICFRGYENRADVANDTTKYGRYIDLPTLINNRKAVPKHICRKNKNRSL